MSDLVRALLDAADDGDLAEFADRLRPFLLVPNTAPAEDGWLDTRHAADYLGMSVGQLHKATAAREIVFAQGAPGGKCWFRRSDLDDWRRGNWKN
jgi:Helix-turn-helix domain